MGKALGIATLLWCAGFGAAEASELRFEFVNPSFGGNPFNSSHLLAIANATNNTTNPAAQAGGLTDAELFVRQLQSRLLSGLAAQVTEAIFGENPQEAGRIQFGDQEIEFQRGLETITLTIRDLVTGSVTEIVVPVLQTDTADGSPTDGSSAPPG